MTAWLFSLLQTGTDTQINKRSRSLTFLAWINSEAGHRSYLKKESSAVRARGSIYTSSLSLSQSHVTSRHYETVLEIAVDKTRFRMFSHEFQCTL
jgi:hypothetical protein